MAAAVRARRDLVVIARTDAAASEGIEGAVARAKLYTEAGADAIFPATRAERDAGLEWVVVDWKTSSSPREAEVGAAAVQLACYRQAFAAWRGIDPATVGGAFFHAADGVTVRPELPDGERLEQLVRLLGEPPA